MGSLALAAILGCGKSETPQASDAANTPDSSAAASETVENAPDVAVVPAAPPELTPEQREAEETFAAMTAQGVSPEQMQSAIDKLLEMGVSAVPVLAAKLQSAEPLDREMAATILAQVGPDVAVEAQEELRAALQDESEFVRANAATALAQMNGQGEHVAPVFLEFLAGSDEHLRRMAAMNLTVLDVDVLKPFIGQLAAAVTLDDREVQLALVALLGRIGPDAKPALDALQALDTEDDEELRRAVSAATSEIEGESSAESTAGEAE